MSGDELNQRAGHNAIYFNFHNAVKRWKAGESGFPKFKKRSRGQSFHISSKDSATQDSWVRMFQKLRHLDYR